MGRHHRDLRGDPGHPFITGLTDGSLDEEASPSHVVQDAMYLPEYARALAICGIRAATDADIAMFARHADGAIEVERELHDTLLGELGIDASAVQRAEMAPTIPACTSYLLATCYDGSFPEALADVEPCCWIHWEVGRDLVDRGSPDPRSQRWIDTYGGEEFAAIVREVIDLTDRLGDRVSTDEVETMGGHLVTTSRYEWMFWDAGHRGETWPV